MKRCPFVLLLLLCGCTIVNEKPTPNSEYLGLWSGPGDRSNEVLREVLPFYSPTGVTTAYWSSGRGQIDASTIIDSITGYLLELGLFDKWPKGNMGYDDIAAQCIAPYHFFIVSIRPTVVIMASRLSTDPTYGPGPTPARRTQATVTKYFENYFAYGSQVVDRPELQWFSPDLKIPPRAVDVDRTRGTFRIDHPKVVLQATLESGVWNTVRTK